MRILLAIAALFLLATACAPIPAVATDKTPFPATTPAAASAIPEQVYQVTAEYLNVRSGPGMQYPADPRPLYHGERVWVYAEQDGWCRIAAAAWCWCYWLESK